MISYIRKSRKPLHKFLSQSQSNAYYSRYCGRKPFAGPARELREQGFTLLEIIIVVALIAGLYAVALPGLESVTGSAVANRLGRLGADIRNAFDRSVLSGRYHRLVFEHVSGNYWLEETEARRIFFGEEGLEHDPTLDEERERTSEVEDQLREYESLAGDVVTDPDSGREIRMTSPVLEAKDFLQGPKWTKVTSPEWSGKRTLGPELIIMDLQAQHHVTKQTFTDLGEEASSFIYFYPAGQAEKAVIHIAYRDGDKGIDADEKPYTVKIDPYTGTAEIEGGYEEVDVRK